MPEPVRYDVELREPGRHRVHVTARFPAAGTGVIEVHLPVWAPGSYLVRDFARNVLSFAARDGRGRTLPAAKVGKSTWRVETRGGGFSVELELYGYERSVRTSHITTDHAFLSPPGTFPYIDALRDRPCQVRVQPPRDWQVACALPRRAGLLAARDYDELIDSPIECGELEEVRFRAGSTPFRIAICGRGNHDPRKLARDCKRVAEAARRLLGGFPFRSYLAILNLTPASRGGLEHRASAALEWPRFRFADRDRYEDFLALFAHELFHAWNVKAAAPRAFRPYDYLREVPTRLLWWFEGVTDYYDELLLRRAGLLTPERYLKRVVDRHDHLLELPGRRVTSVAQASFDAWIKYYRPDENSPNATISYYDKGHLVGLLLDLELRRRTRGRRSLDDVLRRVIEDGGRGIDEEGILRLVEEVSGSSFGDWFARHVDGTDELPFAEGLGSVGLALKPRDAGDGKGAWLGATLRSQSGRLTLATVLAGGPADRAGLSAGDEVVALDGARVDDDALRERLRDLRPRAAVTLTLFRDDLLREARVELGTPPRHHRAALAPRAGAAERRRLAAWLGAPLPALRKALAS